MIDLIALPIIDRAAEGTVDPMETKETGENRKPGGPANSIWKLFWCLSTPYPHGAGGGGGVF